MLIQEPVHYIATCVYVAPHHQRTDTAFLEAHYLPLWSALKADGLLAGRRVYRVLTVQSEHGHKHSKRRC
jgi:hypothetical protein